jgi:hypothetical protein
VKKGRAHFRRSGARCPRQKQYIALYVQKKGVLEDLLHSFYKLVQIRRCGPVSGHLHPCGPQFGAPGRYCEHAQPLTATWYGSRALIQRAPARTLASLCDGFKLVEEVVSLQVCCTGHLCTVRKHIVEPTVIAKSGIAVWSLPICTLQIVS